MIKISHQKGNITNAKTSMKILGITLNAKCSLETHLSCVKSKICMELAKLKPHLSLMCLKDRKVIINSKLKSILDYGIQLFQGESESILQKIESTYMTTNRIIQGGYIL